MALDYLPSPGWAVIYGETPSATRWSELGDNDDALATGAGLDSNFLLTRHLGNGTNLQIPFDNILNNHKARAYASTNQSLPDAAVTQVTFGTEDYDPNNNFASSQYTAPATGYYLVHSSVAIYPTNGFVGGTIYLYKNGAAFTARDNTPYPGITNYGNITVELNDVIYLTAGNTVDIRVNFDIASGSQVIGGAGTNSKTTFAIARLA